MKFINACKNGVFETVINLIDKNRFLAYDFDYCYMTGLHWACKRNHFKIVKLLCEFGCDKNARNIIGLTPLSMAFEHDDL